jgi:hypothetical protein
LKIHEDIQNDGAPLHGVNKTGSKLITGVVDTPTVANLPPVSQDFL